MDDLDRARRVPSPQLVGATDGSTLDLNALTARGVELTGRVAGLNGTTLQFSGSLRNVCQLAVLKQARLLDRIDRWAADAKGDGTAVACGPPERPEPTRVAPSPRLSLDLTRGEIRTVLWATGFRPDYSALPAGAFDAAGRLRHDGGVMALPGLYVLGLPFLRRRKSSFIHGAADDVRDLGDRLVGHLDRAASRFRLLARASHG